MGQVLIEISLQITADKRLRYCSPKLLAAIFLSAYLLANISEGGGEDATR